jgi:acyl carrier protein
MQVASAPAKPMKPFPESEIRDGIKQFWNQRQNEEAENPFAAERENTLHAVLPDVDSLEIVKFMLRIEEIIDIEIPSRFIQRGGYRSSDEMIRHLMPQLRRLCAKHSK